jgi:hypothetical protein
MSKYTPGPWETHHASRAFGDEAKDIAITPTGEKRIIAEVFYRTGQTMYEPVEANARLIATAPELLKTCEAVEMWLITIQKGIESGKYDAPYQDTMLEEIRRVIKLAGGNTVE